MALTDKLTNIANAIREKTGGSDLLTLDEMANAISSIESGGSGGLERITGTITPTSFNSEITHNANWKNYLFHSWISELPNNTITSNSAVEYLYFYSTDSVIYKYGEMCCIMRYNPSTGKYTKAVGATPSNASPILCTLGSLYGPHTTAEWNWEVINLEGLGELL